MSRIWNPPEKLSAYLASGAGEISCLEVREVLAEGKSQFQSYAVLDTVPFGRILVLDDVIQSADIDEWIYHEAFVIPAMCALEQPRRALVLGGGEGAMVREVLRHPSIESVTMVDIDEEVVKVCRDHLPQQHAGAFDDARLELVFDDAREWLERQEKQKNTGFDIILVDLTEPLDGGPSFKLFTREFYELVQRSLVPGGVMALQAGSLRIGIEWAYARVIRTLQAVFPTVLPYSAWITSFAEQWGFAVAGNEGVAGLSSELIDARLSERGVEPRFLDGLCFDGVRKLPLHIRRELTRDHKIATDAEPLRFER